jgi:hypothetical protein
VAFINGRSFGPLYYGHRAAGGTWSSGMVFDSAVDATAIVVDHLGGVHIAFQTYATDAFEYAYLPAGGTTWTLQVVQQPINIAAGQIVSIALDANDQPHVGIMYVNGTGIARAHAHRDSSNNWIKDIAETTAGGAASGTGPRIAVDGTTIKMAYPRVNAQSRYAVETSGTWSIVDVSQNPDSVALALDATGAPHLVYDSASTLVYATANPAGGWFTENAGQAGAAPGTCAFGCGVAYLNWLVLDGDGGAHASFADYEWLNGGHTSSQYLVRYAYRSPAGSWTDEYIDGVGGFAGIYNEIALDPQGGVHVVYTYMTTNNGTPSIKHAYRCR